MAQLWGPETCWRSAKARRVAWLVDSQDYFTTAYETLLRARKQILLVGWGFDPRTRLAPDGGAEPGEPDEIGNVLLRVASRRPDLDIRILVWKSALPISATQEFFPHKARQWFDGTGVKFHLDDVVPIGACHHQKVLVIDDEVAFIGGGDFGTDRWDSLAHRDVDSRRVHLNHDFHPPRHDVMVMVDGPAAAALGDLARERWRRATGETVAAPPPGEGEVWPQFIGADLTDVDVHISRTEPGWREHSAVAEIKALTLECIGAAKSLIYLENQYFTSPEVAEALAARLVEPDGPEVVLVSTYHSPSWFDRLTMDHARGVMVRRLHEADLYGRFAGFSPLTSAGHPIIVHSKVSIFDDEIVRIGSANLNNRSFGFDTEAEAGFQASDDGHRTAIRRFRNRLIGHFLAREPEMVERATEGRGGLIAAIQSLNHHGRLQPIKRHRLGPLGRFIAEFHVGDPTAPQDSFRLGKRRSLLNARINAIAAESGVRRFIQAGQSRPPEAGDPTPRE